MTPVVVLVIVALLVGFLCGLSAISARGGPPGRREAQTPSQRPAGGKKHRLSASKLIALAVLLVDGSATYIVLYLCWLAIVRDYAGALPYLTTLIGALQAVTGVVLTAYYHKAKAENCKGGITYDAALGNVSDSDTDL